MRRGEVALEARGLSMHFGNGAVAGNDATAGDGKAP